MIPDTSECLFSLFNKTVPCRLHKSIWSVMTAVDWLSKQLTQLFRNQAKSFCDYSLSLSLNHSADEIETGKSRPNDGY